MTGARASRLRFPGGVRGPVAMTAVIERGPYRLIALDWPPAFAGEAGA